MNLDKLIRAFTIRTRMLGTVAIVALSLFVIGGVGIAGQYYGNKTSLAFIDNEFLAIQRLASLRTAMQQVRLYEKDLLIQYENPEKFKQAKGQWTKAIADVEAAGTALTETLHDSEQIAAAKEGMTHVAEFKKLFLPVMAQLEAQSFDTGRAAVALVMRTQVSYDKALAAVDGLAGSINSAAQDGRDRVQTAGTAVTTALMAAVGLVLVVLVPLTLVNMNSICKPLVEAEQLAAAIAKGDLSERPVNTSGRDETARLLEALSQMRGSLSHMVGQVRTATDSIGTASTEIAVGNQDLSSRTEQTASNLQQAASSMEQLTGVVKQSADSARQANQLATSAAEVAAKGGNVVAQVVSTMTEINTSSKKINDIIGVIDGIAFQTNILALNAAVEAARAGEQGRGFAVVASEVRSLAQRSAEAAKEIKGLIGSSVEKVEAGSRLVADAGSTMNEIVTSVQRVTDIIGEITAASTEQSQGIGQVNTAVSQLDQMTQQNAALVEQSAASAESLRDQAGRLAQVVGAFRLSA